MRTGISTISLLLMVSCGFLVATGLMVVDELITMLRYCPGCYYKFPLLNPMDPYDAEGIAWIIVITGFFLGWIGVAFQIFTQYGIPLRFRRPPKRQVPSTNDQ